jgi:endonuclease/exonuclease/phosphatase family metal-dependent hydrolase
MKLRATLVAIVLLSGSPPLAAQAPSPRVVRLRLASYNVHQGADAPVAAVADLIRGLAADIVSLQEVPSLAYRDAFAARAGFAHVTGLHLGKVVLSRTPIDAETVLPLVSNRSLVRIATTFEGVPISVYGVHIAWDVAGNRQVEEIVRDVLPLDPNPRKILIGDFNDEHFSTQNTTLESALSDAWSDLGVRPGERTTWPATGFSGSEGHQLIDLLLYDPAGGMFPLAGEILQTVPVLSDHRPVVFTLALTDPIFVAPPAAFDVQPFLDARTLDVRFDREVDAASAVDPARYTVRRTDGDPNAAAEIDVEAAVVDRHHRSVRLRTGPHEAGGRYELAVEGIAARAGSAGMEPTARAYVFLENLLGNPGAEEAPLEGDPLPRWEVAGGMQPSSELRQLRPAGGASFFGGGAADEVSQAVQVVSLDRFATSIDAARATLRLGAYLATGYLSFAGGESRPEPYDDAELLGTVLDGGGRVLLEVSSGKYDTLHWHPSRLEVPLPPGSRSLVVKLAAYRKLLLGGPQNDAALDDVHASVLAGERHHGHLSQNLLENPGGEGAGVEPWTATGAFAEARNYTQFSGTRLVAASGEGLFWARAHRDGSSLSQTVTLPRFTRLDYLRWAGSLRTFDSRLGIELSVELLDTAGRVLSRRASGERREAEWTRLEAFVAMPEGAVSARLRVDAGRTGLAAFADDLLLQVAGGPQGEGWFERGDVDRDGRHSVADAVLVLRRLFVREGATPLCEDAADADDDGRLSVSDAVGILRYLFLHGEAPAAPTLGRPGEDPTADGLGCE